MHSLYVFGILTISWSFPLAMAGMAAKEIIMNKDSFIDWIFRLLMPSLSRLLEREQLLLLIRYSCQCRKLSHGIDDSYAGMGFTPISVCIGFKAE